MGRIPPGACEVVQPVRGQPWWGHAPHRHPWGEGAALHHGSSLGPWRPPWGCGGAQGSRSPAGGHTPGCELLAGCACCLPGGQCPVMAGQAWRCPWGPRSYQVTQHAFHGGRAGGAAGTTLEAYRWGPASLQPPNLEENSAGAPAPGGPNDCKRPTDQQEWARQCAVGTALSGRLSWTHAQLGGSWGFEIHLCIQEALNMAFLFPDMAQRNRAPIVGHGGGLCVWRGLFPRGPHGAHTLAWALTDGLSGQGDARTEAWLRGGSGV